MIDEQYIDLVTAYLDGSITREQRVQLNKLIDEGNVDILDIKQMERLYNQLGKLPDSEPTNQLRENFYEMLNAEKEQQISKIVRKVVSRIIEFFTLKRVQFLGGAAAIFLVGLLAGNLLTPFRDYRKQMNHLNSQVSQMRKVMMLNLLDASSPSERLKAVNIGTEIASADDRVIEALLTTLNNDPNVNVRLASIEALVKHANNPKVRQGLVEAISKQKSPQIQVALADAMEALQETRSIDDLEKLLRQKQLDSNVRDKVQHTIAALKS
ncbi:MAG TPA: HEAT repeat domain-containing protein [Balneolaceae bacterium]|nr:HEAT repeat domain-containing protein [Balneolaceae bacterium]